MRLRKNISHEQTFAFIGTEIVVQAGDKVHDIYGALGGINPEAEALGLYQEEENGEVSLFFAMPNSGRLL